jgi:hypothetical protein
MHTLIVFFKGGAAEQTRLVLFISKLGFESLLRRLQQSEASKWKNGELTYLSMVSS